MLRICQQSNDSSLAPPPLANSDTPRLSWCGYTLTVRHWRSFGEHLYDAAVNEDSQFQRLTFRQLERADFRGARPNEPALGGLRHVYLQ